MHSSTRTRHGIVAVVVVAIVIALPSTVAAYDWLQFNGDSLHSGDNTQETALTAANVHMLQSLFHVALPDIADSAPVALNGVSTVGGVQDLVFVATKDGHLIALNARTHATVWTKQHGPGSCHINNGGSVCYTTASPAIDPNRQFIYVYGLDGKVHKHQVGDGTEILTSGWPELATTKPFDEKGSSSLSIATDAHSNTYLYAASSGYPGDNGDYQGHLTAINLATGAQNVFNALCSDQTMHFVEQPGTPDCSEVQSAIWSRPGVVYDPGTDHIYMVTGNGTFDPGNHYWGDTVFALNPDGTGAGGNPLDSYTPTNFQSLQNTDADLGSTAPAILPTPSGCAVPQLAVQGGKDQKVRLINLANLSGAGTPGPGHTGGEISLLNVPVGGQVLSQPTVWVSGGVTRVYIGTSNGFVGYQLNCASGGQPSLQMIWQHATGGSNASPLIANGVLYTATNGTLTAYEPVSGNSLWTGTIGNVHWESPLVANGVLYMPDEQGFLSAFTLPATPIATNDAYTTPVNTPLTVDVAHSVLANDSLGFPVATIQANTLPSHGTLTFHSSDGSFLYTPTTGFTGTDSFTYTLHNSVGTATGTVTLTVTLLLSGISPSSGPITGGAKVTLTGAGFAGTTSITIGGVAATEVVVVNSTTMTAVTPAHMVGDVDVVVVTAGGTATLPLGYTYGVVQTLPPAQPTGGAGGSPSPLPGGRPAGSLSSSPDSLPVPRP